MPRWLRNQLRSAYNRKDVRLIRLLNDCWYFYRKQHSEADMYNESTDDAKQEI